MEVEIQLQDDFVKKIDVISVILIGFVEMNGDYFF